jgi:DNA polymerase III epsilon subunit-like protein
MATIIDCWPDWFKELYGGSWPRNYCCVDVETTGYSHDRDVITEWGHCLVQDGQVVDKLSLVINWTGNVLGVAEHWLQGRLNTLQMSMLEAGRRCHMTTEKMRREGMHPLKALSFIREFLETLSHKHMLFVAHNGTFDEKMLAGNMMTFKIAPGFTFGDNGLMDTDGIEKASQLIGNPRVYPRKNDTLRTYFHRVRYTTVQGVKSNLDDHCYHKYLKHLGVSQEDMHGAMTDAHCCHLLMGEFGKQITGKMLTAPGKPMIPDKPIVPSKPNVYTRIRGQRCN